MPTGRRKAHPSPERKAGLLLPRNISDKCRTSGRGKVAVPNHTSCSGHLLPLFLWCLTIALLLTSKRTHWKSVHRCDS